MDKEWMHLPSRLVPEYEEGVQKFIAQARNYAKTREVILCPCKRCKNKKYMKFDQVYEHLIIKGIDPSYTIWFFHGETYTSQLQSERSSGGVHEKEDESRKVYHLYRDVFVPEETSPARSKVWFEGHKEKKRQPGGEATGEKTKDIKECEPKSQSTANIADDAISIVFDKEARDRTQRMDFGVIPSKVGASVQQNGNIKQLQSMIHKIQQEMRELRSLFFQYMRQRNEEEQLIAVVTAMVTNKVVMLITSIKIHLRPEDQIASADPKPKVHHVIFGGSCWKFGLIKILWKSWT
ncbi:uncharacterized protein [Henckelia pumila]|uniref:uncharacterized protein n=1 Tax=Henckelia pumila TaxID=405737 RepID=UPI003C6DE9B9